MNNETIVNRKIFNKLRDGGGDNVDFQQLSKSWVLYEARIVNKLREEKALDVNLEREYKALVR